MRVQDIIDRKIEPEWGPTPQKPRLIEITELLPPPPSKRADLVFEKTVFNYIHKNKLTLGVGNIYQLHASRADGLLKLDTGQMVLLEIKYALGWVKSCQARIQFEGFLKLNIYNKINIDRPANALIIFHHFSGDWARTGKSNRQIGWENFYLEQNDLKCDLNIHIAQLTDEGSFVVY